MKADYEEKLADKDALLKSSNSNMSMLNGKINKFRNNFLEKEKELNKSKKQIISI